MGGSLILLVLVVVVALWMVGAYNGLVSLKNQTLNAFKQIDVQLKGTGNIGQLQEELTSTENKVAFARQLYNDTATQYNTKQQQFPTNLVAGVARAQPADLWEIEDQAERAVPQVDLSMKPKP